MLMCLLTDLRWHRAYTAAVGNSFAAAGLPDFVRSQPFAELTETTADAVRTGMAELAAGTTLPIAVNKTICGLGGDDSRWTRSLRAVPGCPRSRDLRRVVDR